ncbi:CAP-Gly domain-containing linker protein 1-like [Elysia marginata]|uniref:CAP-Gly domain-containing linker protein 1-like n=1 Tax=Elysia marginata TaxID=1093978 RepID=A0AAV4HPL1_9GAST|nr:CAP-Gly domain-containing linker protein 1-like [Elysia marginata]
MLNIFICLFQKANTTSYQHGDQQKKIRELEIQLAKSESQKLDLVEQLNGLKQTDLTRKPASVLPPLEEHGHLPLQETTFAKDQYIVKLEKDLQAAQKELATVRQKLKKRIRALTNQLHEARQEASINQMELKAEISQQKEQIEKFKGSKDGCLPASTSADSTEESGHSKIIVELSNQLSEQADHITSLEAEIATKNRKIQELEEVSKSLQTQTLSSTSTSTDRLPSGRGKRSHTNSLDNAETRKTFQFSAGISGQHSKEAVPAAFRSRDVSPIFERQSTALSDSDSDWELDSIPSKVHSAPAGARVKSAVSVSSSAANKNCAIDVQGNDDSLLNRGASLETRIEDNASLSQRRIKTYKKSALKTHLEKKKNMNHTNALIGPSLAFAAQTKEPPSDTSCEPTPRCADRSQLPGFPNLHVINSVSH